jgi:hypothetical protein
VNDMNGSRPDEHPAASLQGGQPVQVPASCRTVFFAAGAAWTVDEAPDEVISEIDATLTGTRAAMQLTADGRPIYFSREMLKTWSVAWPPKKPARVATPTAEERRRLGVVAPH